MSTYRDAKQWAEAYGQQLKRIKATAKIGFTAMAQGSRADLRRLTLGTISKNEARRAGHPWGRDVHDADFGRKRGLKTELIRRGPTGIALREKRRVRLKYPDLPINKQSGKLHRGIRLTSQSLGGGSMAYDLESTAPYAKFIFDPRGTKFMVGRGVMTGHSIGRTTPGAIERLWRARNRVFLDRFRSRG